MSILLSWDVTAQVLPGFFSDYETALQAAIEKEQVLMLDFYTDWCKPCKKLDKEVYGSEEFYPYTSQLVCVKIDFESEEGSHIGKKYNVSTFPTIVFVKPSGEEIERITSYFPKSRYFPEVERIIDGKNTVPQMESRFPNISYGELYHLTYYFSRRVYNKEKSQMYFEVFLRKDPKYQNDSTHLLTNIRYQSLLILGETYVLEQSQEYVLKNAERPSMYELAIRISRSYVKEGDYNKAFQFFSDFMKRSGTQSNKKVKTHYKELQKLV